MTRGVAVDPDRRRWRRRSGSVIALVAAACSVPGADLVLGLALLAAGAVLVLLVRGPSWSAIASSILPAAERASWRAELGAVLHAAPDRRERRRQLRGFVLGLPACAATGWYLTLAARR